jgi:hypothetical protein
MCSYITGVIELDIAVMNYLPNVPLIKFRVLNRRLKDIIDEILYRRYRRPRGLVCGSYVGGYPNLGSYRHQYQNYTFSVDVNEDCCYCLYVTYRGTPIWSEELADTECTMESPSMVLFPEMGLIYVQDGGGGECICNISDGVPLQRGHMSKMGEILVSLHKRHYITDRDCILGVQCWGTQPDVHST